MWPGLQSLYTRTFYLFAVQLPIVTAGEGTRNHEDYTMPDAAPVIKLIAVVIDRETLSTVQFLRLIDRDGIGQSNAACHIQFLDVFNARGRILNNMAAGMKVIGLN